jgi:hypothetical protein
MMHKIKIVLPVLASFFWAQAVQAQQAPADQKIPPISAHAFLQTCAPAYQQLDSALFTDASASGDPARWVQYLVSQGCPKNKDQARQLLMPLFGASSASDGDAPHAIHTTGKFSGDQSQTYEKAGNGEMLKSHAGGAHLYTFQMFSRVNVTGIPEILYKNDGLNPPKDGDPTKNVALWVRYSCAVPGQGYSTPLGDPGTAQETGTCPNGGSPNVFDRVLLELKGPYRNFFDLTCTKNGGQSCETAGEYIWGIQVTLTRKPAYSSFMKLLSGGYVTP